MTLFRKKVEIKRWRKEYRMRKMFTRNRIYRTNVHYKFIIIHHFFRCIARWRYVLKRNSIAIVISNGRHNLHKQFQNTFQFYVINHIISYIVSGAKIFVFGEPFYPAINLLLASANQSRIKLIVTNRLSVVRNIMQVIA